MSKKETLRKKFDSYLNSLTEREFNEFSGDFLDWTSSIAQACDVPEFVAAMREHLPEFTDFGVSWDAAYSLMLLFAEENHVTAEAVVEMIFAKRDSGILLGPLQALCNKDRRLASGMLHSTQLDLIHLNAAVEKISSRPTVH